MIYAKAAEFLHLFGRIIQFERCDFCVGHQNVKIGIEMTKISVRDEGVKMSVNSCVRDLDNTGISLSRKRIFLSKRGIHLRLSPSSRSDKILPLIKSLERVISRHVVDQSSVMTAMLLLHFTKQSAH